MEKVILVSAFKLAADSKAAEALRVWKMAGGLYKDLIERALECYAETEEYAGYVQGGEE
jgi:hypothetical protein